jgi:ABC-type uncharacterized transport system substrate-binding protein
VRHRWIGMFLLGLAAVSVAGEARAHPHIFIADAMTVIFGDHDIAGLRLSWTFDEMYSSMIRTDYVHGPVMTPAEVAKIEKENFLNLGNYGFFLDLAINGAAIRVKEVKDFVAKFQGNKIVFEFTVPLQTVERKASNVLEARVFDPEYYVEFTMRQVDPVAIEHGGQFAVSCNVARNEPKVSALGPVNTDRAICTYAGRP